MMAEGSAEASGISGIECSTNLPDVVASMEMLTVDNETTGRTTRYSMRKRVPKKIQTTESLNRRCSIKPKKRSYSTMESETEIHEYYLDKSWKRNKNTTLETIYEEIDGMSENSTVISGRKLRRLIPFEETRSSDAKVRKRNAKIKRAFGSKIKTKPNRVSMKAFLKKWDEIQAENFTKT